MPQVLTRKNSQNFLEFSVPVNPKFSSQLNKPPELKKDIRYMARACVEPQNCILCLE